MSNLRGSLQSSHDSYELAHARGFGFAVRPLHDSGRWQAVGEVLHPLLRIELNRQFVNRILTDQVLDPVLLCAVAGWNWGDGWIKAGG